MNDVRGAAVALLAFILPLGFFAQGGFYLPSAITMLVATVRGRSRPVAAEAVAPSAR